MKEFPTEAVLSLTTGRLLCEFQEMHEAAEYLTGGSVWAHQFAHGPFNDEMRAAIFKQHPQLRDVDASGVTTKNWTRYRDRWVKQFGPKVSLSPMAAVKTRSQSFTEPLNLIGTAR